MSIWDEMSGHVAPSSSEEVDSYCPGRGQSLSKRLIDAVEDGDDAKLEELLLTLQKCKYIEPYEKATAQTDVLIIACRKENYTCARAIIENISIEPEILKSSDIQNSLNHAFVSACRKGDAECVERLLKKLNANPDANDGFDNTPLIAASERGHADVVKIILRTGCNVNRTDTGTRTALHWAAMNGHIAIVEALLAHGALPDKNDQLYRFTPLMLAARQGHAEVVRILLRHVSSFNNVDMHGETALFDAVRNNQVVCVQLLLSADIDVNHVDNNGRTPLLTAVLWNRPAMVKLLVKANCRLDIPGKIGYLQTATTGLRSRNELATRVGTPLEAAILEGNLQIAKMLVMAGCNKNVLVKFEESLNYLYSLLFNLGDEVKQKMAAWLAGTKKQPRDLKDHCRIVVRKSLDTKFMKSYSTLPIPKVLQEYLTFPELDTDDEESFKPPNAYN